MALASTLSALAGTGPATRNRVSILLDKLKSEGSDDYSILVDALDNPAVRSSVLTKALRKEYGHDVVKDSSIGDYRRSRTLNVNGL